MANFSVKSFILYKTRDIAGLYCVSLEKHGVYRVVLVLIPQETNSMTFVLGSSVQPGGAPPGPLSSGFLLDVM